MQWSANLIMACVVAPFVGSFLGVVGIRVPVGEPFAYSRSKCPSCAHQLSARDLVPLLSWLWRRGRCGYCDAPISLYYPAIELAALVVVPWAALTVPSAMFWASVLLGWVLIVLSAMDIRHGLLADVITLPLILAGLAFAYFGGGSNFGASVMGAALGVAGFVAIAWGYRKARGRDGLGMGDAKLMGAAGSWVGWAGLPSVLVWSSLSALVAVWMLARIRRLALTSVDEIRFGPYLALGFWLVWLYGPIKMGIP